jgi:diguanylate cyclase (GGDEF)-like protein/PAS domain S-box-containing protein
MFQWIRALAQTTTSLGVVMVAVIWGGVFYLANEEREHAVEAAMRQGSNLTRVFEEYISRVIRGTDSSLLTLRELYENDPQNFDLLRWTNGAKLQNDLNIQFVFAGPDGNATLSSLAPIRTPVDIRDRDYFQFHANSTADELYISRPVIGRVSNKATIQLVRRLRAPDRSFGGIVLASLDIEGIEKFYNSVDIGSAGIITLVGFDGIIRARSGPALVAQRRLGQSIAHTKLFEIYRQSSTGSYWNFQTPSGTVDGVRRLISYRVVEGLPLLAVVGLAESDVFHQAASEARHYYQIGFGLTALVLVVMGFGAARQFKFNSAAAALESSKRSLEASKQSLEQTNMWFDAALENMTHGLCMFDRDQRLIVCNRRYGEMYGLTSEQTRPGTTLRAILEARVAAGNSPEDAQDYINRRQEEVTRPEPYYAVNELRDGRVYAVNHQPMQGGGWVAIHEDITSIRKAEARAETANQELIMQRHAVDQAMIVTVTDVDGCITFMNDNLCRLSGYAREELLGTNHRVFKSGIHSAEFFRDMYNRITCGEVWRGEICNKRKDGSLYWLDTTIVPRLGPDGKPVAYMTIRNDITARKHAEMQIAHMARHDALTGLANRVVLLEKAEEALTRLRQGGGERFNIFMLDLDLFKDVNDSLGHPVGDELLKAVALRLLACTDKTDTVVRLGGDEFAILETITGNNQRESAIVMANRLLQAVSIPYDLDNHQINIGTSIGVVLAPEHGLAMDQLMKNADMALYKAKSAGRNTYSLFEAAMGTEARTRRALEVDLRNALLQDEFELHYHPIVDIKTQDITCVEALVRWNHPLRGRIAPDDFIPLAEETGLINPLGEWVLRTACMEAMNWPPHVKVAVNLSAVQFRKGDLVGTVSKALSESGLPPQRLELEITETVLMQGNAENVGTLHQLLSLGISIALDDFGTGYSSLSYLRMFPFGKIKIDRSFVNELSKNADCAAIVSAVAGLGRSLHVDTVAEGVETSDQLALVRAAGCTHAQGFLFGRPCPASELQFRWDQGRQNKKTGT